MKIAFDAQLLTINKKTGIGWSAYKLIETLSKYKDNNYTLNYFTLNKNAENLQSIRDFQSKKIDLNECFWFHSVLYKLLSNTISLPYHLFFGKNSDITFFFSSLIPPGVHGKTVTIVHDMTFIAFPETMNYKTRLSLTLNIKKSCRVASKIITVSQFSKDEMMKYLDIDDDKIVVMPNGVDLKLYHPNHSQGSINTALNKYSITSDYFLYLGTLEPRKNIVYIIKAYNELKKKYASVPTLVLAGGKGWLYESIFKTVSDLKLNDSVIFTGYVDESDCPLLLQGAKAFLFPSLYEGFGMPPLEAMACGTPVIVSNAASLPEVVGDAGLFVDPYKPDDLTDAMLSLLNDDELCKTLSIKGIDRASEFTWERSAEIVNDVFKSLSS